ncbi:dioxygenase [Microbacterium halotolerans]|uniref:dioxygenase n=1 Tax=Microbacterium halotolerans TaxID=246613 RepID=UPI000E6A9BF9|nr:dioxygenase [Microbacterium halotolerans]
MAHGKSKTQREERERAQRYIARTSMHKQQQRRRKRDNIVASAAGAIVLAAAIGAQIAYYGAGPGVAELEPAPTSTTDVPSQEPTPLPLGE